MICGTARTAASGLLPESDESTRRDESNGRDDDGGGDPLPRQGLALCGFFEVWHDYLQKCQFKRTSSFGEVKPGGTREPGGALAVAMRLVVVSSGKP